jgi:hypothetical protein
MELHQQDDRITATKKLREVARLGNVDANGNCQPRCGSRCPQYQPRFYADLVSWQLN